MKDYKKRENDKIYSKRIRAGKRTYFFDVKATSSKDYYVTITERKKRAVGNEHPYEKHHIFLYKEDFNKFVEALDETVDYVKKELMPEYDFTQFDRKEERTKLSNAGENNGDTDIDSKFSLSS
ncbi:MAG: PUR family DNA/RNA-binding protein [Cytophagales bacterium]|nr:PUR family DNA/RNA-binding protein [Cytophagales bacterium]